MQFLQCFVYARVRQSGVLRGFLSDRKFRWGKANFICIQTLPSSISQSGHTIQYTIGTELLANTSLIEGCLTWISERSCLKFIRVTISSLHICYAIHSREMLGTESSSPALETTSTLEMDVGPTLAGTNKADRRLLPLPQPSNLMLKIVY